MASRSSRPRAASRPLPRKKSWLQRTIRVIGPGVISGAADEDPSGVAAHSQAGAQFGFGTLWTSLLALPLLIAVQEISMRVGAVTGKGLTAVLRDNYSHKLVYPIILAVVFANTFNIGTDIGAMAASLQLLAPHVPFAVLAIAITLLILVLVIVLPYKIYMKILRWLALALLAYIVTALFAHVPWQVALKATIFPTLHFNREFLYIVLALLGTTISPHLFIWQASNVVEEEIADERLAQRGGKPRLSRRYLWRLRLDTVLGMSFAAVCSWFILVVGAVVLHAGGVTNIGSAADAAKALAPLVSGFPNAGLVAEIIFTIGIVGLGLISIPVMAAASSYAMTELFGWKEGLFRRFNKAREFYLVIIIGTLLGLLFNFIGLQPIYALIFAGVLEGIVAPPLIFMIARVARRRDVMGGDRSGFLSQLGLWATFFVMSAAAIALLISLI